MNDNEISGKWINTKTCETVIARNIVLDGEEAIVVTNEGMIPMNEFTDYVQIGDENISNNNNGVSQSLDALIGEDDKKILKDASKNTNKPVLDKPFIPTTSPKKNVTQPVKKASSNNWDIVNKLFSKFNVISVKVNIEWGNFPKDQINTLIDIFDVPKEEIADYIANKYASIENIAEEIGKQI